MGRRGSLAIALLIGLYVALLGFRVLHWASFHDEGRGCIHHPDSPFHERHPDSPYAERRLAADPDTAFSGGFATGGYSWFPPGRICVFATVADPGTYTVRWLEPRSLTTVYLVWPAIAAVPAFTVGTVIYRSVRRTA